MGGSCTELIHLCGICWETEDIILRLLLHADFRGGGHGDAQLRASKEPTAWSRADWKS